MSLAVWLPLTKDLRNQGLSDVTVTNNGATFNSAGKLGGCYSFNGSSRLEATLPTSVSSSIGSLACWVKFDSLPTSSAWYNLIQLGAAGGFAASRLSLYYEYGTGINISIDGSSTGQNYIAYTFFTNTWYHIACTNDGTTVKVYINGNQILSKTATKGSYTTAATKIYCGGPTNYYLKGSMNDARYYNHCLSPMEVKELAKGLVLHYPLNRGGWGQENLVWNSNWNLHSTNPPENWNNWGSPPTREIVTINGKNWLHVISNTTSFQGYSQNWTKRNGVGELGAGQKVTVSFTAYLAAAATIAPIGIHWNNSSGTIVSQNWTTTALTTSPQRYTFTYTTPADCVAFNIMVGDNTNTAHEVWITDIKLEFGEKATPWCPNSSDALATTMGLNGTTEYDCSGFCNNGTRTGTFSWTSDTPKYQVSSKIAAASTGIKTPNFYIGDVWSMSVWFKYPSQDSTSWKALVILNNNGGDTDLQFGNYINCSGNQIQYSANGKYTTGVSFTYGEWHHVVNTYDGTTLKCYLDGVYKTSVTPGQTLSRSNLGIGFKSSAVDFSSVSNSFTNGFLSDVRIYATALSASDVQSLYQNSAYIDSNGNVYGAVHSEV